MYYLDDKYHLYVRPNHTEEEMTGLHDIGFNDFHRIKASTYFRNNFYATLHFILDGKGTYLLNGKKYELQKGYMFYTPANIPLCYYPNEGEPWKYVWFSLYSDTLLRFIPHLDMNINEPCREIKNFNDVKKILDETLMHCETGSSQPVLRCAAAFMQIMSLEAHKIEPTDDPKKIYVQNIKKYIEDNFASQDFNVDALCNMMHLSHSYICRIFSAHEGCTVMNYIENIRLEQAAKLLISTDINVSRISSMVGYRDSLHFMKCFKKKFNCTALEYRRRLA